MNQSTISFDEQYTISQKRITATELACKQLWAEHSKAEWKHEITVDEIATRTAEILSKLDAKR